MDIERAFLNGKRSIDMPYTTVSPEWHHTRRFEEAMNNPWAMKMEQFTAFTGSERARLDAIIMSKQREFQAQEDVIADGAHSEHCHVLLTGLVSYLRRAIFRKALDKESIE